MNSPQQNVQFFRNNSPNRAITIYNKYGLRLYNICRYRFHLSEEDAWIILKISIPLVAHEYQDSKANEQYFEKCLGKVFINEIYNLWKLKRSQYPQLTFDSIESTELENIFSNISTEIKQHEFYSCDFSESPILNSVVVALEELSPQEVSLLLLKVQNYSDAEIAKFLDIPISNLEEKNFNAKRKLINILKQVKIR